MNWFEYRYKTLEDVIANSKLILDLPVTEQILILIIAAITIIAISYWVPFLILIWDYKKELEEKRKKKQLLKQILLQNEIENEIEKLYLKDYTTEIESQKLTIGIPRILFMHKLFPMFNEFFKELGFNVILTGHSDKEIIAVKKDNHPLVNTYVDSIGNAFLIGKRDGDLHPLNPKSNICSRDNAHKDVSCATCHSSWS